MRKTLRNLVFLVAVLWSTVLLPAQAFAQTASLACDGSGGVASGQFFDDRTSIPGSACQFPGGGAQHIFSQIICAFTQLINEALGKVYCGMQYTLSEVVATVITLYVALFGAQMLMGMANLTAKEFLSRVIKIALVWVFVSESAWGINVAFSFFVTLAADGVGWVLTAIPPPAAGTSGPCFDPMATSATGFMEGFMAIDEMVCNAILQPTQLNEKIIGLFVAIAMVFPPIVLLGIYWIWLNFKVIAAGLITFLLGIAAIAFLIAMSPIFLSMMLFKSTYSFFENWLKFLMSFSLQIIIVFACISLWFMTTAYFIEFLNNLGDTIQPVQTVTAASAAQNDINSWGVCPFDFYDDSSAAPPPSSGTPYPPGPIVICQESSAGPGPLPPATQPPMLVSTLLVTETVTDPDEMTCRVLGTGAPTLYNDCTKYFYYIIYHLITLIIVCFAFDALLREAPTIAVYLAGPEYVPLIGQGFGVNRLGQTRSLFSPGSSGGGGRSQKSGGSLFSGIRDLFRGNDTRPPIPGTIGSRSGGTGAAERGSIRTVQGGSTNVTQQVRERTSGMQTER